MPGGCLGLVRCSVGTPLEYLRVPNEGLVDPEVSMGRGCGEAWMRRARRGEAPLFHAAGVPCARAGTPKKQGVTVPEHTTLVHTGPQRRVSGRLFGDAAA